MKDGLIIEKTSNSYDVVVDEVITYKLKLVNTTDTMLHTVIVKDLLSGELEFIKGSIQVDGLKIPEAEIDKGINVGTMGVNTTQIISYSAKVLYRQSSYVMTQAMASFEYYDEKDGFTKIGSQCSNIHQVMIEIAEIEVIKIADQSEVCLGDEINYRIVATNKGTLDLKNLILVDVLPSSLELIVGSLKVNGIVISNRGLEKGICLGNISNRENIYVDYRAKVIGGACSGYIRNEAYITYDYERVSGECISKKSNIATVDICARIESFKQLTLDKYCLIPIQKPDIEEVDDVTVHIEIDDSYVIDTFKAISNEGQRLSGYKLIIHGHIQISIEYTAQLPNQPIHSAHFELPFSTFLILPSDYRKGARVEVGSQLENVDIDIINNRGAVVNMVFLIVAKTN